VNSSAPATTTSSSPRQKATPPSTCAEAKPNVASDFTMVKKSAPRPMKAPASPPSNARGSKGKRALTTPTFSTRCATSRGA